MYHIDTADATSETIRTELERLFDTHTVTADLHSETLTEDTVQWSVTCNDCGKTQLFTVTIKPDSVSLSSTHVEAFETRSCTTPELPNVDVGAHTVVAGDELARDLGTRACYCTECNRTIHVPMNDSETTRYVKMFADIPCCEGYTDAERSRAVVHPVNPIAPQRDAFDLSNWQYEAQTTRDPTTGYWWHEAIPVIITLNTTDTEQTLIVAFVHQPLADSRIHDFDIQRADTDVIAEIPYSTMTDNGTVEFTHAAAGRVLRFMELVNDMTADDSRYQQLRNATPLSFYEVVLQQDQ